MRGTGRGGAVIRVVHAQGRTSGCVPYAQLATHPQYWMITCATRPCCFLVTDGVPATAGLLRRVDRLTSLLATSAASAPLRKTVMACPADIVTATAVAPLSAFGGLLRLPACSPPGPSPV